MNCDLLLKNGRLYNPKRGIDKVADLAIQNGKIVYSNQKDEVWEAKKSVDVSGCLVVPGLIDIHTHLHYLGTASGMPADLASIPYGVTASLDAGSTGVSTVRALAHELRECSVKTKFMLNVSASGIIMANQFPENVDPSVWDIGLFDEVFAEYGDQIPALKLRISKKVVGELGLQPVKSAIELSERYHVPICIHTTNPPDTMSTVAQMLRNGKMNFSVEVCQRAMEQGFLPDVISTDMSVEKIHYGARVRTLPFVMSKFLSLGMNLTEVVRRTTEIPAALMGMQGEIGTLCPGSRADICICKLAEREVMHYDTNRVAFRGSHLLIPQMTVVDGKIAFGQIDFSLPEEDIENLFAGKRIE